jgi:hypothetical protein
MLMGTRMLKKMGMMLVALTAGAGTVVAETSEPATPTKCQVAEVNPVTGHVTCLKPLGAPVDPLPATEAAPCKPSEHADAEWTWGPNCTQPKGMRQPWLWAYATLKCATSACRR